MRLTGVLATHYHADHVGGNMMGYSIDGVGQLLGWSACRSTYRRPRPSSSPRPPVCPTIWWRTHPATSCRSGPSTSS
ncbi:MAG: hypothetical protein R2710_15290 [Acidimicrobiales bacterium]